MIRDSDYIKRHDVNITTEERGVLALVRGLDTYTRCCAPRYADECAAREMGIPAMFETASAMLSYAPDSLDRGALSAALAEMLRAWHVNPDTFEYEPPETGE